MDMTMKGSCQAVIVAALAVVLQGVSPAEAKKVEFEFKPPVVGGGLFTDDLNMLDRERGEFASNLAAHAANVVAASRASKTALEEARRAATDPELEAELTLELAASLERAGRARHRTGH